MDRKLKSGLAARAVIFGLAAVLIYWVLPDAGLSALRKMNAAMQNARSWRMDTVVTEPTKKGESTVEVYCPSRFHEVSKESYEQGGKQYEETSESFWIEGTSYMKKGPKWVISQEERAERARTTASCSRGPRSTDALLDRMDFILMTGKIRKGDRRTVNGDQCRDWIASASAPEGWRDEFGVCIGDGDLPREVFAPDRQMVETYSEWNVPIRIEAPATAEMSPQ
jgi:hypothetical protein